jgi:ABC-type multidrug transport system ATPase subunit/pSer/pThr/pTyr-binding forkhead associated (FHA) protein/ABC-type multidrug transport system permease subunit
MSTPRRWVVGRAPDCDLVVGLSEVSSRHCRLTEIAGGFLLEDLNSSNGTFVNGQRIRGAVRVTRDDQVTLGQRIPLPWPEDLPEVIVATEIAPAGPRVIRVGRASDNDVVLENLTVSSHHARITFRGGCATIEDLGSSNGTAIGHPSQRITRAPLSATDVVYLGSLKVPATRLLADRDSPLGQSSANVTFRGESMVFGRHPDCDQVLNYPMVSARHARLSRRGQQLVLEDLGSSNGTFVNGQRVRAAVLIQPGDVIGLGTFTFTLTGGGQLERRDYRGNATLEARGITVVAGRRRLIEDVSLTIFPSEFVGLMGPSGAGKTTLMLALNGYTPPAGGAVLLNGQDLYRHYDQFRSALGYVPQEDVMHRDLTVGQALYYTARLRLPPDFTRADIRKRIRDVLGQLGLTGTEDVLIGSAERKGISGGQRRRVNLAMELLTDPLVLFLDEPTSGLSSEDALTVMKVLRLLADAGKTILLTIHQPSLEVFRLMDNLVLVGKDQGSAEPGRLVYYGPAYPDPVHHFNPEGVSGLKPGVDPSPDEVLRGLSKRRTVEWTTRYQTSKHHREYVRDRAGQQPAGASAPGGAVASAPGESRQRRVSGWYQWLVLVQRLLTIKVKDRMNTAILLAQAPIVAVLLVMVFGRRIGEAVTDDNWDKVSGSLGITLFLMALAALWFGASNAVREIVGEWAVYHRERMVNLKIIPYVASKFTVLGGLCVLQCLLLLGIVHAGCGMKAPLVLLFTVLMLAALVGTMVGLTLSALAKTSEVAIALLPIVLLPMVILGGAIQPLPEMHRLPRWICQVIPTRWAFEGLVLLEAKKRPEFTPPRLAVPPGQKEPERKTSDMAQPYFQKEKHRTHPLVAATVLAAMLGTGACGIGVILRRRDVH